MNRHKYAIVLCLLLFSISAKAQKSATFHERVQWQEADAWGKPLPCSLEMWAENPKETHCTLRVRYENRAGAGQPEIWDTKYTYADPQWAEITLATLIRVKGTSRPQILVSRSRANWGDYILYSIEEGGLRAVFSVSHRDPGCVRWKARNGALQGFTLYDRWKPTQRKEPPGMRWQERSEYAYDRESGEWRAISQKWETYRFESELNNPVLKKVSDCSFRFHPGAQAQRRNRRRGTAR